MSDTNKKFFDRLQFDAVMSVIREKLPLTDTSLLNLFDSGIDIIDEYLPPNIEASKKLYINWFAYHKEQKKKLLDELYEEIKHGDAAHQQWLKDKMEDFKNKL